MTAAWWVAAAAAFAGLWAAAVGLLVLTRARIWGVARRTRPRPPRLPAWRLVASGRNHADAVSLRRHWMLAFPFDRYHICLARRRRIHGWPTNCRPLETSETPETPEEDPDGMRETIRRQTRRMQRHFRRIFDEYSGPGGGAA